MSKGQTPLFYVLTLVVQLNFGTAALAAGCPMNPFVGSPICNQTCSKPPQIRFGDKFRCKVGFKVEWLDFRNKYNFVQASIFNVSNSAQCKAPLMTGISLHPLQFQNKSGFSPALRVVFNTSFIAQKGKPELKAILLEFQSPVFETAIETRLTDQAYSVQRHPDGSIKYDKRRHRLFDFATFIPDTYDLEHPITIGYPCLYGLDDCSNGEKVYIITLTSLLMTMSDSTSQHEYFKCNPETCYMCSLNYTISVYPVRYNYWNRHKQLAFKDEYEKWNMTIATALYPSVKDIYVLLEPTKETFDFYSIRLTISGRIEDSKNTTNTSCTFKALSSGSYKIKVLLCRHSGHCMNEFETYHTITIEGTGVDKEDTPIPSIVAMIVACVSGTTIGVLLIAALAWLRCSRMNQKNGKGIEEPPYIILSNGDRASVGLSTKLGNALVALGVCNVLCPKNSLTVLKSIEDHTYAYLLILLPVEHKTFQFQISKDNEYEQVIKSLESYKIPNMFLIYFPYIEGAKRVPWEFLKKCKRIHLMKDYNQMIRLLKIKNDNNRTLEKVRSDLTTATEEAKQILMTYCETSHRSIYQSNVSIDSAISCQIHKPQYFNRKCPVHSHRHDYPSHPFVYYPDCGNDGIGNGLVNNDHHETIPLLENTCMQIIAPSPIPSLKLKKDSVESKRVYSSESSGYETSPVISSDNNMDIQLSLEDDKSINEAIVRINWQFLPLSSPNADRTDINEPMARDTRTESMEEDIMYRINFL